MIDRIKSDRSNQKRMEKQLSRVECFRALLDYLGCRVLTVRLGALDRPPYAFGYHQKDGIHFGPGLSVIGPPGIGDPLGVLWRRVHLGGIAARKEQTEIVRCA